MTTDRPCWLLTGFEPFGGATVNPSEQIARALDGRTVGGARIVCNHVFYGLQQIA